MRSGALILLFAIGLLVAAIVFLGTRKEHYSDDHPILNELRKRMVKLDPEFAKVPLRVGNSSYTENKEVITLCLKDPHTGKYYSMNTLQFIANHEWAHMLTKSHGHTAEFRDKFAKLLKRATQLGIYDPSIPIEQNYCGIDEHPPPDD